MEIHKIWLSIAIVFILTFSLLSPAAVAEEISTEREQESSSLIESQENRLEIQGENEPIIAENIELSEQGPLALTQDSTFYLTATVSLADTAAVEWTSSNLEIATVENELITAVATFRTRSWA